jgi:hypothetical protein
VHGALRGSVEKEEEVIRGLTVGAVGRCSGVVGLAMRSNNGDGMSLMGMVAGERRNRFG